MDSVTADSNIYVSALNFGGLPDKVLDLARNREISLFISTEILDEISRVLRDKFEWTEDAARLAGMGIRDYTENVQPRFRVDAVKDDPADNKILECGLESRSDFIVTGDKHLLTLRTFEGCQIIKVADFLKRHL